MIAPDVLRRELEQAFPGATVSVTDLTGTQDHYQVSIMADAFRGQTRMRQHKLVYEALGGRMGGELHALQLVTAVPN